MTKYIDAERLRAEIKERLHCNGSFDECGDTAWDYDQGMVAAYNYVLSFIDSLQQEQLPGIEEHGVPGRDFIPVEWVDACEKYGKWKIVQQEQPDVDLEQAAARYERENRQCLLSSVDIVNAFMEGAKWQANQLLKGSPLPEDTVIFQKGVAEGRRLEREDNNKALAEMYGYEGGTESELVKITFTIPKEHFKRLMPIKQGDVFGIENLTNKEVVG